MENTIVSGNSGMGKKSFPGSTLKIIAMGLMLLDHIGATILEPYMDRAPIYMDGVRISHPAWYLPVSIIDALLRCVGRLAFPIFIFLMVEGFKHTSNKGKYALRLLLFAVISEVPFDLANDGKWYNPGYQSVYVTLLLGFLFMWFAHWIKDKNIAVFPGMLLAFSSCAVAGFLFAKGVFRKFYGLFRKWNMVGEYEWIVILAISIFVFTVLLFLITMYQKKTQSIPMTNRLCADLLVLVVLMHIANLLSTDYSCFGVLAIAVAYALRNNNFTCVTGACVVLIISNPIEIMALSILLFLDRYNGERGLKIKYSFYAFYPVHLFILYVIAWLIGAWPGVFGWSGM